MDLKRKLSFKQLKGCGTEKTLSPEEQQAKVLDTNLALLYEHEVINFMLIVTVYACIL